VEVGGAVAHIEILLSGMIGRPGIAAQIFQTLSDVGINIDMISTSEVKVSCVIAAADCDRALTSLSAVFEVNSSTLTTASAMAAPPVRGVALDKSQAQLAIRHVPDRPGMAAQVFSRLAQENISVDMIIQSQRCHILAGQPTRDIACTVAQADAEMPRSVLSPSVADWPESELVSNTNVAKGSIVGAGMVGHPGVASQMFAALAQADINIQMIATSEITISCVVAQNEGEKALKAIHRAFNLAGEVAIEVPA
jgi:aspartate kinase